MGQAWRPSSSMIYGSPDRQAVVNVGRTMMGQLQDWSDEQIEGEYRRQTSNASIAAERERHNLVKFMDENKGDPGAWRTKFAQSKEAIRKAVLAGVTQPRAKEAVSLELNESLAAWEKWIDESAAKQTAVNTNTDYETHLASFEKSYQYRDDADFQARVAAANEHIEAGYNGGRLPVDSLPNPEAVTATKRKVNQRLFGDYALQRALAGGDEGYIDRANEEAKLLLGDEALFGPDEMAKLRERYESSVNGAKTEAEKLQREKAEALDRAVTDDMVVGKLMAPDGRTWRQVLEEDRTITPARKTTLIDRIDAMSRGGKEYGPAEKLRANDEIYRETDPTKKEALIFKHVNGLGYEEGRRLLEQVRDPAKSHGHVLKGITGTIDAIRDLEEKGTGNKQELAKLHLDLLRTEDTIVRNLEAHPEWTATQQIDYAEKVLAPEKEKAAKATLKSKIGRLLRFETRLAGIVADPVSALIGQPAGKGKAAAKPTPEELRRQNTREAYEKGKALGYWQ